MTQNAEQEQISQSYWSLVWWKFKKNRLAILGGIMVILFYVTCVLIPEFMAPVDANTESEFLEVPPMWPRFRDAERRHSRRRMSWPAITSSPRASAD